MEINWIGSWTQQDGQYIMRKIGHLMWIYVNLRLKFVLSVCLRKYTKTAFELANARRSTDYERQTDLSCGCKEPIPETGHDEGQLVLTRVLARLERGLPSTNVHHKLSPQFSQSQRFLLRNVQAGIWKDVRRSDKKKLSWSKELYKPDLMKYSGQWGILVSSPWCHMNFWQVKPFHIFYYILGKRLSNKVG